MEDTLERLGQTIQNALGPSVTGHVVTNGELTVHAKAADVVSVAKFLRDDPACQFVNIIDVTAVDWPSREKRFDVVYHFLSPRLNQRIRLKVATDETTPVPSLIDVFRGADWFEREITTCTGCYSPVIPTCEGSSPTTGSKGIRSARTFRSPVSSRCATTASRNASSTRRLR